MTGPLPDPEPSPPAVPRGRPVIAWAVILALFVLAVVFQAVRSRGRGGAVEDGIGVALMKAQGRYLVGSRSVPGISGPDAYQQALALNTGPLDQRLRFIVLAGELAGPEEALRQLDDLRRRLAEKQVTPTDRQASALADLQVLYTDYNQGHYNAPSLGGEKRLRLRRDLGWFGELALAPAQGPDHSAREAALRPARRTMFAFLSVAVLLLLLGLVGLAGQVVLVILLVAGVLRSGLSCGQAPGGVYAETFAVWMVLFIALGLLASLLAPRSSALLAQGITAFLSLSALAWPVFRGVPWRQVRQDIGLTTGRRGLLEPGIGAASYVAFLPLVFGALLVVLVLNMLQNRLAGGVPPADNFAPGGSPAHPLIVDAARGDWWTWAQIVLAAVVVAPIVEEVVFRGVLYRHLREASRRFRTAGSAVFSATVVSFVFAAIHPQGLVAVPLLMVLAFGFTFAREWRGTLVPAMTAHALNNGLATAFMFLAVGS